MSLKLNEKYPGRFNNPSAAYPQGSFKNRTTPTSEDGSYFEQAWANDQLAFLSSLLEGAGLSANGFVDEVGSSQYYDALISIIDGAATPADATTVIKGILRLATQSEVNSRSNDTAAVTPMKLGSGFVISKSPNGYIKLPDWLGGLVIQWGVISSLAAEGSTTVTFPLTFPTAIHGGLATVNRTTAITGGVNSAYFSPINTSQATIVNDGSSGATVAIFWLAIGN